MGKKKKKTFEITAWDKVHYTVTIEADSAEEAEEKFLTGEYRRKDFHEHEVQVYEYRYPKEVIDDE